MGSKVSSEKDENGMVVYPKRPTLPTGNKKLTTNLSQFFNKDANSSYTGLRSESDSHRKPARIEESEESEEGSKMAEEAEVTLQKIPTPFSWRFGGNMLYVTGSFSNWKQWFMLNKLPNGEFHLVLDLPKGVYQYKFIVDGNWVCSQDFPQTDDGSGNVNNVVDNSFFKPKEEKKPVGERTKKIHKEKTIGDFSQQIPKKIQLNCEAPVVPLHYSKPILLKQNTKQHSIGNIKYLKLPKEKSYMTYINSMESLSTPPHINVNHLKTNIYSKKKDTYLKVGTTTRVLNKYVTTIYYKPI